MRHQKSYALDIPTKYISPAFIMSAQESFRIQPMLTSSYALEVYFTHYAPLHSGCILADAFLAHLHQHLPPMHVSECTDE